jgi:hypothetical protein
VQAVGGHVPGVVQEVGGARRDAEHGDRENGAGRHTGFEQRACCYRSGGHQRVLRPLGGT